MFIEEKTLCSSVAQSCLQKLGCKREPAICGPPHHGRAMLALGFRVGQTQTTEESHIQKNWRQNVKYGHYLAFCVMRHKGKVKFHDQCLCFNV